MTRRDDPIEQLPALLDERHRATRACALGAILGAALASVARWRRRH